MNVVRLGDGPTGLYGLTPGSASLVLSDLPSGETQAEFDTAPDMQRLWHAIWSALKPDGVAVLMASSLRFASDVMLSDPAFRYDLVWRKSLATGHLNAPHRPLRAHEFVLVFFRERGTYNQQMTFGHEPQHKAVRRSHGENYGRHTQQTESRSSATDRYPVSVLDFSSVGTSSKERRHPQQKPVSLLSWIIRTYTNPGDLVADPFAGSGSAGVAAESEGRRFVGWDSSPRFGVCV